MTTFAPGDLVEVVVDQSSIQSTVLRPGSRGVVVKYEGPSVLTFCGMLTGGVYSVDFSGWPHLCCEKTIRKIPPDPGREVVDWAGAVWRPTVEA